MDTSTPTSLALLLVEDSALDAELIIDALLQAGYHAEWRRVENEIDFRAALLAKLPDAILSDWTIPGFSGRAALSIMREVCPEVPFLYVTGTTEESCAIEALRQGANDFVYKHQLPVLGAALARILAKANERRQHLQAELDRHRLSEALCQTLQPVILTDLLTNIIFVNPAFTRLLGYGVEELRGKSVAVLSPNAETTVKFDDIFRDARETGKWSGEVVNRTRDGVSVAVYVSIGLICEGDGSPEGFVGNYFDLRPLRESEDELRAVSDSAYDAIIITDDLGNVVRWNAAAERMFGYTRDDIIGQDLIRKIVPSRDYEVARLDSPQSEGNALYGTIGATREMLAIHKDGHEFPAEMALSPVQLHGQRHAVAIIRDITERRRAEDQRIRLEEQLHQSQKMDAIGQLTGGIAHDFNNLLGVLIGNLDLVHDHLLGDQDGLDLIDAALDAALRGAELNKRLLASARRQALQPKRIDVQGKLGDVVSLLKRSLGERIEIKHVPDPACWPILADPSQFDNAIVNLGVNARDAMPNGGALTIETRNVSADAAFCENNLELSMGDYVAISVSDSGCGMAPEVLSHVFEPFYTTKPVGKGTGLGLSMVHGFAKQSGGQVSIYSEIDKGTTVRLYLPRFHGEESQERPAPPAEQPPSPIKTEALTVLVVDDNPDILKVTVRQMHDLGYRTKEAKNADEALALINQGMKPDILFTDIVMPGTMDGLELADRLRTMIADLPVVLCSGFTERAAIDARGREGRTITDHLLAKPFRKDALARALSSVLQQHSNTRSPPHEPLADH